MNISVQSAVIPLPIQVLAECSLPMQKTQGAVMFVDISGFTPLTEQLMQHGTAGAEVLSDILNDIFAPMVSLVYAAEGVIPHFAGDAFSAIFEVSEENQQKNKQEKCLTAHRIAEQIIHLFNQKPIHHTPFGDFAISLRIGLSFGAIEYGIVGEPNNQSFYFRGEALEKAAEMQRQAPQQGIAQDFDLQNGQEIAKIDHFSSLTIRQNDNRGEFRNVVSVFLMVEDLNDHQQLNEVSTLVLEAFQAFSGYFKELDFGDKGSVMVGFFGAPVAFENNVTRALECLQQLVLPCRWRVGVTSGIAYTGMVGGAERSQYAVVGSSVNLAARLMVAAEWGEILCDHTVAKNKKFTFAEKGNFSLKGIKNKQKTYLLAQKKTDDKVLFSGEMVGRNAELRLLEKAVRTHIKEQKAGMAFVLGEAGIGKSRLAYELGRSLNDMAIKWTICPSDQTLRKPFNSFIYYLKTYFQQSSEQSPTENKAVFEQKYLKLCQKVAVSESEELLRLQSIMAALIGLQYADSLWEQLDAKGRYENTLSALSAFFTALAHSRPLVIELEDAHWLDDASEAFLRIFVKNSKNTTPNPIFLLFTARYNDEGQRPEFLSFLAQNHEVTEIDLNILKADALRTFAQSKLNKDIHPDLEALLWRTTNGNPFYAEQILAYFVENNLLELQEGKWAVKDTKIKISTSISAILTARIDRLSFMVKETVKAAAVIGREFEVPILNEVLTEVMQHDTLQEQIKTAERGQIWRAMNELRYIFRHTLLREAVYDMQLRSRLRELHLLIAKAIEKIYQEQLDDRFIDLAFHYEQAENKEKTIVYLKKAGDYARRNYQNHQALDLYDRLLKKLDLESDTDEMVKILVRKGEVLQLIGEWQESEMHFKEALTKIGAQSDLLGRGQNALGTLLMLKGDYTAAEIHLQTALTHFKQYNDQHGLIKVSGNLGNLFFRQADYEAAKNYFVQSIQLCRSLSLRPSPQITANLGLTYMNQGNYREGVRVQEEELSQCEKTNDVSGMAILCINMGIILLEKGDTEQALGYLEQGLDWSKKLGNKQLISIALGCLGNVFRLKGDFEQSEKYLLDDLQMCEELGDRQGIAIASELLGRYHTTMGFFSEAIAFYEKSVQLCQALNYQKGVAKALQGIGEAHLLENDYLLALEKLDKAINVCEKINYQLLLGQCLIDKGNVLMNVRDFQTARQMLQIAQTVAQNLGNEQLNRQVMAFANKM